MSPKNHILIIAHRGASGYLPEHTLEAKGLAHAMAADFLEQDLVLTKDEVPIVLHDVHLDTVTDVARKFPNHARDDGRYYAIDFTIEEIKTLMVSERFDPKTGLAVFPNRFPVHQGSFRIPTFEEELQFIQGLNRSTGRTAGIYPEIKQPAFHRNEGKDITRIVIEVLKKYHYESFDDPVYLQCFDSSELRRIREKFGSRLKLVQLLESEPWLNAADETELRGHLARIAEYAQGIGPPVRSLLANSQIVMLAHDAGLVVHPWTYRADALPKGVESFVELHRWTRSIGIDGIFTDFPDQSRLLLIAGER